MFEKQLLAGTEEGHYRNLPSHTPYCSPVSAIPKAKGGILLIHDFRCPSGRGQNDNVAKD